MIIRKDTQVRLPVRCITNTGTGVINIVPANISDGTTIGNATVVRADGSAVSVILVNGVNWIQIDNLKAPGLYHVVVPDNLTDIVGTLQLSVVPLAGAFQATVITAQVETVGANIEKCRKVSTNRWKIHTTGIDANRLVIYDDDGTTILFKLDLKDSTDAPTTTAPFSRTPV